MKKIITWFIFIAWIILLISLTACSPTWHVKKAVKKGWTPQKEVVEVERLELIHTRDSITNEIIRVDTIKTKETKTIFQDRPLTRQERLALEREFKNKERVLRNELAKDKAMYRNSENEAKNALKIEREKTKQLSEALDAEVQKVKIQEKGFPWRLIFIVFVAGVLFGIFRKNIWQLVRKLVIKV
jgi:hypothetical protein